MTDEERREAERLAEETLGVWNDVTGLVSMQSSYFWEIHSLMVDMYAAACETKRTPECHMAWLERDQLERKTLTGKQSQGGKTMLTLLEAERARSAKLKQWVDLAKDEGFLLLANYLTGEKKDYPMFYDSCDVSPGDFAMIWYSNLTKAIAEYEASRD